MPGGDPIGPSRANGVLDRTAAIIRLASVAILLPYAFWIIAMRGWDAVHAATFVAALLSSAGAYHVLTSVRRCARCTTWVSNFGIDRSAVHKRFTCARCGGRTESTEGFVWYSDSTG